MVPKNGVQDEHKGWAAAGRGPAATGPSREGPQLWGHHQAMDILPESKLLFPGGFCCTKSSSPVTPGGHQATRRAGCRDLHDGGLTPRPKAGGFPGQPSM